MEIKNPTNKPLSKGKTLLLFDIDGTLAPPYIQIEPKMVEYLTKIKLENKNIDLSINTGSQLEKLQKQMGKSLDLFTYIFTENGLIYLDENRNLHKNKSISEYLGYENLKELANFCLIYIANLDIPIKTGTFFELRHGMINVCPIGRNCSQEERKKFIEFNKQHNILNTLKKVVEDTFCKKFNLNVVIGGQISVDIYPNGWDKTYCLQFIRNDYENIIYFGDKGDYGGNDYTLITSDKITKGIKVKNHEETIEQIDKIIQQLNLLN